MPNDSSGQEQKRERAEDVRAVEFPALALQSVDQFFKFSDWWHFGTIAPSLTN